MDHAKRVDRCLLHALKSIGVGLAVGMAASTLIFKRKRWAFILATGYGVGSAVAGCDFELFHQEHLDPCEDAKKKKDEKEAKKIAKEGKKDGKKEDDTDAPKNLDNSPKDQSKKDGKAPPPKELSKKDDKAADAEKEKKAKK